jgi:hypothetical protein
VWLNPVTVLQASGGLSGRSAENNHVGIKRLARGSSATREHQQRARAPSPISPCARNGDAALQSRDVTIHDMTPSRRLDFAVERRTLVAL